MKTEEVLWSEHLNLASRSAVVTSSDTGKLLTITDPQFTLLENGYVNYLLGLNGIASGKGISIVNSVVNFNLSNKFWFHYLLRSLWLLCEKH